MKHLMIFFIVVIFTGNALAQTEINGTVTDVQNEPLIGATVIIKGTTDGIATDFDGKFQFSTDLPLPITLTISYIGFNSKDVIVEKGGDVGNITLAEGEMLEEVIVSASRAPEKVIEAVASVTSLGPAQIAATPSNGDPTELLRNVQGVNLVRSGTQFSNIELRGSTTVNETNTLILKDYMPLTTPVDKSTESRNSSLSSLDIARVEVVRGPVGALYGPNVTSGVVHFITKDPFKYPGLDVAVGVGDRSATNYSLRYAGNNGKKFGWKLLTSYSKSTDFAIAGEGLIDANGNPVVRPKNMETLGGKTFYNVENLDQEVSNWFVEGTLAYKFSDKVKLNYLFSLARSVGNSRNQTGQNYRGMQRYEQQLRIDAGNFFAALYHRHSFGNIDSDGNLNGLKNHIFTVGYSNPPNVDRDGDGINETRVTDPIGATDYYDISAQYTINTNDNLRMIVGADSKISPSIESPAVYGINDKSNGGDNSFNIYGGYISGKYKITDKLAVSATGRVDHYSAYKETAFSPRIGMVYNPSDKTGLRLSFSRAFESQSQLRTWLDFPIPVPSTFPETHIAGVGTPVTYNNPVTKFAFGNVTGAGTYQFQDIVNALATNAGITAPSVSGTIDSQLTSSVFSGPGAAGVGASTGPISNINQAGQPKVSLKTVNQFEIGYSTVLEEKLKINVDLYYSISENFQPAGSIPISPGSQLNLANVQAQIEAQVPAGNDRDALLNALYSQLGTPSNSSAPGYGLVISDLAQANGWEFDAGFPTFGNESAKYIGADIGLTYYITPKLIGSTNYSYVSKNIWTPEDLGETNQNYQFYLNSPTSRVNLGLRYGGEKGFYGSISMNYASEYEGKQGDGRVFTGVNPARTIVDSRIGYKTLMFNEKAKVDFGLSVQNLFDEKYSHFVNLPELRRFAMFNVRVGL
ncbi:TonB-dependent Receptor Plug Domain [Zobellia uliginosa]|uniref:TonB-dependent Receptor Plug Domain n=1 Tax=Zobellia uliginosa TaxID=143224 RepID=A0ABY1KK05_9FLAO|nr:TonB-dependent receptor [Zobellia uliginosa]SIS43301.1 TonB-dependent Receptor Plug Domain [Zobellia uliginosa]